MVWATVRAGGRRGCVVPPVVLPSYLSAVLRVASRLPLSVLLAGIGLVWFAVAWLSPAHAHPESASSPVVGTVALAAPLRSAEPAGNGGGGDDAGGGDHDGGGNARSKDSSGSNSSGKSGGSKSDKGPGEDQTGKAAGQSDKGNPDSQNGGQSGGTRRDRGPDEQRANNAASNTDRNPGNRQAGQTGQQASQRTGQQPDQEQTDAAAGTRQNRAQPGTAGTGEQPQPDQQPVNAATGQHGHPTAIRTGTQTEGRQTFASRPRPTDNVGTTSTGGCGQSGTCTAQTANLTRPQDGEHQATGEQTCQAAGGTGCGAPGQATQQGGTGIGPTQTARTTDTATQPQPDQQLPGQPNPSSPANVSNSGQTGNAGAHTAATGQQANAGQADTRNASAGPDSAQRTDNRPQDTLAGADPPTPGTNSATNANLTHSPGATTTKAVAAGNQPNATTTRGPTATTPTARTASLAIQQRPNDQVISDNPSVNNPQLPALCGNGTCPGTPDGQQPGTAPAPGRSSDTTKAEDSDPQRLSGLGNLLTRPDLRGAGQPDQSGAQKPGDDRAPLPAPSLPAPNPNTSTNLGSGQAGASQAGGHRSDVDPGLQNLFDPTGALRRTDDAGRQGATDPQALPVQGRAPPGTEELVPNGDGSPRREYSEQELRNRLGQGRLAPKEGETLDDLSARQRALDEEIGRYNGQREHPQEQYNALKAKQGQLNEDLRGAAREFDDARALYNQARGKGGLVDRSLEGLSPEKAEKVLDHMATRGVPRTTEDLLSGLSHQDPAAPGTADAAKRETALKELFVDFDTSSPDKQLLARNLTDPERLDQAFRENADFWGRNARKFDRSIRELDGELKKRDLPQLYDLTKNAARALIPGGNLLGSVTDTLTDPITRSLTGPASPLATAVDNNARGDFNDIVGHLAENGVRSIRDIRTELSNLGKTPKATNPNASPWDQFTGASNDLSNHALIGETPEETYERLVPFSAGIHQLGGNIANRYAPLARGDTSKLGTDYYNHPLKSLLEDSTPLLLVTPGGGLLRAGAGKILSGTTRAAGALRATRDAALLEHLDRSLPTYGGGFTKKLNLTPEQLKALPRVLRDHPDFTYREHARHGYVSRNRDLVHVARPLDSRMAFSDSKPEKSSVWDPANSPYASIRHKAKKAAESAEQEAASRERREADSQATRQESQYTKSNSPRWRALKPFRGEIKTNAKTGSNRRYYVWDHTHSDIEVFDRRGDHLGSMDAGTGRMTKPPVRGRKINVK